MKCVNPNCKAELAPTDNFCGQCRQKVEKNQHDLKKCPSCESLQKASVKYCSNCSNEIDKGIICEVNPEKSLSENGLPLKSATLENSPENSTDIDTGDGNVLFKWNENMWMLITTYPIVLSNKSEVPLPK